MSELQEKIKQAEQTLRLAAQMSEYYYHQPLIVCYSGGKDSDVMLDIAKKCLNADQFEVVNHHTTVDAPETVYHIRNVFKELKNQGYSCEITYPMYKGKRTSMWRLIEEHTMPPTRLVRYCCKFLKETAIPNRLVAVGVREAESKNRQGRDAFVIREKREVRSLQHTYAMFELDKMGKEDAYECEMIEACKTNKDTICNPIYYFNDADIWEYVKTYNVTMNPLYSKGYKRVGCVGCPLANSNLQKKEFADYPKYKLNYIKSFERMQKNNEKKGYRNNKYNLKTGEDWFRWWIGENPKQIRIDDILIQEAMNEQQRGSADISGGENRIP